MKYTIAQFNQDYADDDACLRAVFNSRYGDLDHCPKCAVVKPKYYRVKGRKCFECGDCGYQLYPLVGSIFQKSTTPLKSWFYAMYLMSVAKNGISAKELERHLGVTYKTAWRMCKQIRTLMHETSKVGRDKAVEIDETFIGGRPRAYQTKEDRPPKQAVLGMVERTGRIRVEILTKGTGSRVLIPAVMRRVYKGTQTYTDEYSAYKALKWQGYKNRRVNHSKLEFVRNYTNHTNTIEGFWSQLKRSLDGTYHCVSPKYLQSYLDEFAFRYSYRGVAVYPVLLERGLRRVR